MNIINFFSLFFLKIKVKTHVRFMKEAFKIFIGIKQKTNKTKFFYMSLRFRVFKLCLKIF